MKKLLISLASFLAIGCSARTNIPIYSAETALVKESRLLSLNLTKFNSCEGLQKRVYEREMAAAEKERAWLRWAEIESQKERNSPERAKAYASSSQPIAYEDAAAPSTVASSSAKSYTNVQEAGVDEADNVKITDTQVFVIAQGKLHSVSKATLQVDDAITLNLVAPTLYVHGKVIAVIAHGVTNNDIYTNNTAKPTYYSPYDAYVQDTYVRFFSVQETGKLQELNTIKIKGNKPQTRLINNKLYLVTQADITLKAREQGKNPDINPVILSETNLNGINCDSIYAPILDNNLNILRVSIFDLTSPLAAPKEIAQLGDAQEIYMTSKNLYIASTTSSYNNFWILPNENSAQFTAQTAILKMDLEKNAFTAVGAVPGYFKDQWSFHEDSEQNALGIVTTTGELWETEGTNVAENHVFFLKEENSKLKKVGAIQGLGRGENVRSVRFIGKIAYFVTFKKTDPLFAVDFTNVTKPNLLGEIKIPGFSTYLHPVSKGRLLGLGFDAADMGDFAWYQGLKVSLFDINDPKNMKEISTKIIGQRGSYSEATGNHHAFMYDAPSGWVAFPAVELSGAQANTSDYSTKLDFSGAVLFNMNGENLNQTARISHFDLLSQNCQNQMQQPRWWEGVNPSADIRRIYVVDSKIMAVSSAGISLHSLNNPEKLFAKVAFSQNDSGLCD